ncbi:DNA-processing protein DprA [Defluviitalea phaphyphila]|uniref:DNA-processing protein DprA n=1 Tax=Defluviitalea phaphyphila TaxID=1473580 RepID=UPI000730F5CF|nr:DNA-processing protein DprA [Defluviitalea phaphyphila]
MSLIDIIDILTLLSIDRIGRKSIYNIFQEYKKERLLFNELKEILTSKLSNIDYKEFKNTYEKSKKIVDDAQKSNIHIISFKDSNFPIALKSIPDPPLLLFIKGNYDFIKNKEECIAVVGTRNPTYYGKKISRKIGKYLASNNIGVISGLALGCDTNAHIGCLEGKGRTAAILAHGLNMIYPYKNKRLAEEIIYNGGCIISEYPPHQKPKNYTFIERNRLQSGLSKGIIVIETGENGGTMHTIKFAIKQDRKIACIKSSFLKGNEIILKNKKVTPIENYSDINYFINNNM